jgi:hypothetical protein
VAEAFCFRFFYALFRIHPATFLPQGPEPDGAVIRAHGCRLPDAYAHVDCFAPVTHTN